MYMFFYGYKLVVVDIQIVFLSFYVWWREMGWTNMPVIEFVMYTLFFLGIHIGFVEYTDWSSSFLVWYRDMSWTICFFKHSMLTNTTHTYEHMHAHSIYMSTSMPTDLCMYVNFSVLISSINYRFNCLK
jgi:hypothetical protein